MASERIDIVISAQGGQDAARIINSLSNSTQQLSTAQRQAQTSSQNWGRSLGQISTVVNGFIGLQVVQFIGRIGMAMVQGAMQMEMYRANFETMMGSAEAAGEMLQNIRDMAARTPFETEDLVGATQTLMQFGVAAEDILPNLRQLGDISLGNNERLRALSLAFGQVSAAGRLTGQDLLQMINAGFNPLQEMVRTGGHDLAYWRREMEQGRVSSEMITRALQSATEQGGRFHDGMAKGAETLAGKISTLKDNFKNLGISIAEALLANDDFVGSLNNVFAALSGSDEYWDEFHRGILAISDSLWLRLIPGMEEFLDVYNTTMDNAFANQSELEAVNATHLQNIANRTRRTNPPATTTPGGGTPGGGNTGPSAESYFNTPELRALQQGAQEEAKMNATAMGRGLRLIDPDATAADLELYQQHINGVMEVTKTMASGISGIMDQVSTNEKMRLQNDYNSKKAYINANVKDEAEKKKQLEALDAWYAGEQAKQAKEQAKRQKAMMLMNAIVNTATGITSALAMSGPPWVGLAMAAIVGAMGAAQIALISSQPIPEAAEGALIRGSSSGSIIRAGEEGRSEMIVPFENDDAMDKLGGFGTKATINLNIENLYATEDIPVKMAQEIDKALYKLFRNRNSMFGSAVNG